ncbi:follistatin-related protein 1-like isoform X1 [Ptychodera flava]|uniref:follistatin-related protein 1-like isoform X1 n=1 Tax=Ptychodera flava TaxID=63121 RepID=UPI00396AA60F
MEFKTFAVVVVVVLLANVAVQGKDHKAPSKENLSEKEIKKEHKKERTVCEKERVQCGSGRECVEDENGEPTCECIKKCPPREAPVCATNGKSYDNHCELHRAACLEGVKLHIEHDGRCAYVPTKAPQSKPVVCYQNDRDRLRQKMIDWMVAEEIPDGWFSEGKSYNEVLKSFFNKYDQTGDGKLDSNEMLKLVEGNDTAKTIDAEIEEIVDEVESENEILRGLCVDALIDIGDEDADWVLNLKEFENCMDPEFSPPHRRCSLEDEFYEDGAETKVNCNSCVCACGNWVCTAMICDESDGDMPPIVDNGEISEEEEYDPELDIPEEMTQEEFEAYVAKLTVAEKFDDWVDPVKELDEERTELEIIPLEKEEPFENAKDKKHMKEEYAKEDKSTEKF